MGDGADSGGIRNQRIFLKRLFGRMKSGMITEDEVAINLSVHSLEDEKLREWLFAAMQALSLIHI